LPSDPQESTTDIVEHGKVGTYRPFSAIVEKEGGDVPAYWAAVENVKSCLQLHQSGKQFKGRAYVQFNTMTKRTDFMHFKETVAEKLLEQKTLKTKESEGGSPKRRLRCKQSVEVANGAEPKGDGDEGGEDAAEAEVAGGTEAAGTGDGDGDGDVAAGVAPAMKRKDKRTTPVKAKPLDKKSKQKIDAHAKKTQP